VARVADGLVDRMGPVIADLDDRVDGLEEAIVAGQTEGLRLKLAELRREAIALRRYIAPQREAMARLLTQQTDWIDSTNRHLIREVADKILRYVEDLDAARERAQIAQDELSNRVTEQINRNMYVLSIVAAIFLPLSLLTGYLGINVGGIPGEKWQWSFTSVGLLLVFLTVIELWLFRRLKWI
jgi:zinc transporter